MLITQTRNKPKLNKHIINTHTHTHTHTQRNKEKQGKSKKPKLETLLQH